MMKNLEKNNCCFFGHRKIDETEELKNSLCETIENLIVKKNVDTFLLGSRSDFDTLCLKTVTKLKEKYPHIRRIYIRASFPDISDRYEEYLLENYEETYYPENMRGAGRASYVERNQEMINHSAFCVVYYDKNYLPPRRKKSKRDYKDYQPKSGTAIAYHYALEKKKEIINICFEPE